MTTGGPVKDVVTISVVTSYESMRPSPGLTILLQLPLAYVEPYVMYLLQEYQ